MGLEQCLIKGGSGERLQLPSGCNLFILACHDSNDSPGDRSENLKGISLEDLVLIHEWAKMMHACMPHCTGPRRISVCVWGGGGALRSMV